jgi:acyl carrier protein phosphodiesterase
LVIEKMVREDWLQSYRTADGIDRTLKRLSRRLRHENPMATAIEELERNHDCLQEHFLSFFPQVLALFRPTSEACNQAPRVCAGQPSTKKLDKQYVGN